MILSYTLWGIILTVITAFSLVILWVYKAPQKRRLLIDSLPKVRQGNLKRLAKKSVIYISGMLSIILIGILLFVSARPKVPQNQTLNQRGLDIMLAVDISGSMNARDVLPSRIEASQAVISGFINKLQTDRVGLVVFSGIPMTLAPLTNDYSIFSEYMELLTPQKSTWLSGGGGTAVGDAILLTTQKFQKDVDRQRVIILITDGQSNVGISPEEAAQEARKEKIRIYTIYIGSSFSSVARRTLENVALETGGKSYTVEDKNTLEGIFIEIDSLERKALQGSSLTQYSDSPDMLLFAITSLWLLLLLLGLRRELI